MFLEAWYQWIGILIVNQYVIYVGNDLSFFKSMQVLQLLYLGCGW